MVKSRRRKAKTLQFKPEKLPKPKLNELRKILKGYVSPSITERLNALSSAVLWYRGALNYVMSKPALFPTSGADGFQKTLTRIQEFENHAEGTTNLEEKDTTLRRVVKSYENICQKLNVPKLDSYTGSLDKRKALFDQRTQKLQSHFGGILALVEKALGIPFDVRYCDTCQAYRAGSVLNGCSDHNTHKVQLVMDKLSVEKRDAERKLNPGLRTYFFNQKAAKDLLVSVKREGAVPVLFRELRLLAKMAAGEQTEQGTWIVGRDRLLAIWEQGMFNLENWMKSGDSPFKMFRIPQAQTLPSGEKKVKVKRAGGGGFGKDHLGPFMMRVLDALSDGKVHTTDELTKLVMNPHLKIDRLIAKGYSINKLDGGKYQYQKGEKK